MSVFMILRVEGDPDALEEFAQANAEMFIGVANAGKASGATRHAFAGGDGEILVIDEWPSAEAFQAFFDSQPEMPRIMQQVAQGQPQISFYRKLDMPDIF